MDYKTAGVDIDAGNQAVQRIKPLLAQTQTPNVLNGVGNFAGFFEVPQGYKEPVLVSCTDGVGTKLKLAIDNNQLDTVGIDLVAMCVNDLICSGAKPLYFLDYIAVHSLIPEQIESLLKGMATACASIDCAIIGGEMAEMNDLYKKGDCDVAGFSVGIVEKNQIIDGSKIKTGQHIYALPSSGIHSNGYSLVRKILEKGNCDISMKELLTPTKLYVNEVLEIIQSHQITGIAHITGGGLIENCERILPEGLHLQIDRSDIPVPEIFTKLQDAGAVSDQEMNRVFNMGIGLVLISDKEITDASTIKIGEVSD